MIKANLWFTNLSTTEQSPDASYRLSIIKRSDGMQYVLCSEIPADAKMGSNPFVDHVSGVATAVALEARKKGHRRLQKLSLSSSLWYANEHRLHKRGQERFSYFNMLYEGV